MHQSIVKRRLLAFCRCIKIINPVQNNDFTTHYLGIEGNFTCIDRRACPHGCK